jgi:hypothetical protein
MTKYLTVMHAVATEKTSHLHNCCTCRASYFIILFIKINFCAQKLVLVISVKDK